MLTIVSKTITISPVENLQLFSFFASLGKRIVLNKIMNFAEKQGNNSSLIVKQKERKLKD
jgi:hypothetical protein